MRTALLRGRHFVALGAVDAVSEGPAAVAISRGGAKKTYPHTDPNEDGALFALGEGGWLGAVADGHRGFEAAEVALEHLAAHPAPHWTEAGSVTDDGWSRQARAVFSDAHRQILEERATEAGSRTTLALAVVQPAEGRLLYAATGDSHIYRVRGDQVVDLTASEGAAPFYLGKTGADSETVEEHCRVGVETLQGVRAVVLATDGLSEERIGLANPAAAVLEVALEAAALDKDLRALHTARSLVERAMEAHRGNPSGDNIAIAALWTGG